MIISGSGCQANCKIAGIDKDRGLIAQTEERGVCNAEAMGSNPIESSAVKANPSRFSMHLEMRVTREGLKVIPDLLMPCNGLHSGR